MVKDEWQMERKFIYATFKAVERFMGRRHIFEPTFGGTVANDRLFASGCFVASGLQDLMNFNGTYVPTQEKRSLLVSSAANVSCEATIYQSM
jgi:hypothetical protein